MQSLILLTFCLALGVIAGHTSPQAREGQGLAWPDSVSSESQGGCEHYNSLVDKSKITGDQQLHQPIEPKTSLSSLSIEPKVQQISLPTEQTLHQPKKQNVAFPNEIRQDKPVATINRHTQFKEPLATEVTLTNKKIRQHINRKSRQSHSVGENGTNLYHSNQEVDVQKLTTDKKVEQSNDEAAPPNGSHKSTNDENVVQPNNHIFPPNDSHKSTNDEKVVQPNHQIFPLNYSHKSTNDENVVQLNSDDDNFFEDEGQTYLKTAAGYQCNGITDIVYTEKNVYIHKESFPFYKGKEETKNITIPNRSRCLQKSVIPITNVTTLNVTVESCCITWCAHKIEINVNDDEHVLLNFIYFNVPGLSLAHSEVFEVCDEALRIILEQPASDSTKASRSHLLGSFCGVKKPKTLFVESSKVRLELVLKENEQCVNNVSFVLQIVPCLKLNYQSCDSPEYVQMHAEHGYISSPGLAQGYSYPNDLHCTWNISVPDGKLIHLQKENLDLREGDFIRVFPRIEKSRRFPNIMIISNDNFRAPIVLPSNKCLIELHSHSFASGTGFKISYSAVHVSQFIPMFDNQSLDCSNITSFKNVPTCNFYIDCANGEDERGCYYQLPDCWPQGYSFDGRCYQVILNQPSMSWTMAEEFCERNLSSHLLTISTTERKRKIEKWLKFLGLNVQIMFLGLRRMRMQQVSQMYRRMWQWTDRTTAFYLPNEYRYEGWATCSLLHGNYFYSTDCGVLKENISFICERKLKVPPNTNIWNPNRQVTPFSEDKISVFKCHSGEFISGEQRCDKMENCFDRSDELDCNYQLLEDVMFSCDTQGLLAYTFVCDGIDGCLDASDEKSCASLDKTVLGPSMTTCTDGMLLERSKLCDGKEDCRDSSDEEDCTNCVGGSALCPMIACLPPNWQTDNEIDCPIKDLRGRRAPETLFREVLVEPIAPPGVIVPDGYGKFEIHLKINDTCPSTHVQCEQGYCIPVYMWCNGMLDCPGGEDENPELCKQVCVGMYKCKYAQVCVHSDHLCDGYYQCPNHDDELLCGLRNLTCPQNCTCTRMEVNCTSNPKFISLTPIHYLRLQNANMPDLKIEGVAVYSLIYLNVSACEVKRVRADRLKFLNLRILDLSHNLISSLPQDTFLHCPSIKVLNLAFNKINNVALSFLEHTRELMKLDLSYNTKNILEDDCFFKAASLEELIMRYMHIHTVAPKAFSGLLRLKRLDLKGNELATFHMDIFKSQSNLRSMVTDNFRLCCSSIKPKSVQFTDCDAPYDEISSCADILRTLLLRVALWLMAVLTITGNIGVIIYRIFYDRGIKYSFRIIITCLSASDLIMGIYLVIIGSADVMYRDRYLLAEREWKTSSPCQVAGFLCMLSSETSALFILLVTVDRLLAIAFPLHPALHFNAKSATVACILVWAVGIVMATVPLLPPFQHWELYSQKAVGVPLPITRIHFPGYDYAFAIFILFNMAVFLLVAMGQLLIYLSVHLQKHPQISEARVKQDTAIAKRLVLVVITDCLCWFPITVMGLAARSGQPVPGEMYLVTTVFLLPANSAFNPFLYTANAILLARRQRRQKKKESSLGYEMRQLSQ